MTPQEKIQLGPFPLFTGFFTLMHEGLGDFAGEVQGNEDISRIRKSFSATSMGFLNTSRDCDSTTPWAACSSALLRKEGLATSDQLVLSY